MPPSATDPGDAAGRPPADLPAVVTRLYAALEPLSADERRRAIHAVLAMLGDAVPAAGWAAGSRLASPPAPPGPAASPDDHPGLAADAQKWLKRSGLSLESVEEFFQLGGEATTAFTLPAAAGQSKRDRTTAAYLFQGVAALLGTGKPTFPDDAARQFCVRLGCYDQPNHAKYVSSMASQLTGSKAKGYTLTQPGLAAAAALLRGA